MSYLWDGFRLRLYLATNWDQNREGTESLARGLANHPLAAPPLPTYRRGRVMVDFDLHEERAASEDAAEQAIKDAEENGYKAGLLEAARLAEERADVLRGMVSKMLEDSHYGKVGASADGGAVELADIARRLRAKASE